MNSIVCNYAIARFMPYRESGEFVNIGIVAVFPQRGLLLHRFETKRYGRITNFFPELDKNIYLDAQDAVCSDVARFSNSLFDLFEKPGYGQQQVELCKSIFHDITRRRESMIYFSDPGVMLCNDAHTALEDLYQTYIVRQFAKKREYQEHVMQEQLRCLLHKWNLSRHYKQDVRVGNDDYSVRFPFVYMHEEKAIQAIRPLNLSQERSYEIYDHGDKLLSAVKRLNQNQLMPNNLIIPVSKPEKNAKKRLTAANAIESELKSAGARVIPFDSEELHSAALIKNQLVS